MIDRRTVGSLLFGFIVILLFIYIVGIQEVLRVIAHAELIYIPLVVLSFVVSLVLRGTVWYGLFYIADITVSYIRILSIYIVTLSAKFILPAGYFALQPFIAYIISKDSYLETERVLSIITLADSLTVIPYYTIGLITFILLSFRGTLPGSIESYIFVSIVVLLLIGGAFFILWYRQDIVRNAAVYLTSATISLLSYSKYTRGYIEGTPEMVENKIDNMYDTMSVIFEEPLEVFFIFLVSHLAALAVIGIFIFSGMALSIGFSIAIAAAIVVIGKVGLIIPSPGGVGGVEPVMITVTILFTGIPAAEATVLVLLYRLFSYWGVVFVGSAASSVTKYDLASM